MEVVNLDKEQLDIFGDTILLNSDNMDGGSDNIDPDNLFSKMDQNSPTEEIDPDNLFADLDDDNSTPNPELVPTPIDIPESDLNQQENSVIPDQPNLELGNNITMNPAEKTEEDEELDAEVVEMDNEDLEFEVNLDNINILNEQVRITEVESLEENKIIADDKEQMDDLLNELMRKFPEKMRNSEFLKNKILKKLRYNIDLKLNHSIFDKDKDVINHKEKGDNYKPLLEKYKKYNFNDKFLIPIVSEVKKIYNYTDSEESNLVNKDFYQEISQFNKIKEKYTKGIGKKNYSYINENKEISELLNPYDSREPSKKLDNDVFVVRDCFTAPCNMISDDALINVKIDGHKLLGKTYRDTNIETDYLNEEDRILISGFLMVPIEIISKLDQSNYTLEDMTMYFNDFRNLNYYINEYDTYVETVDIDIKQGDKVKLCFTEGSETINLTGEVISIDLNKFTIKPDDDSISGLLEVSDDDKNVTISKDHSIKNITESDKLCYNDIKDKIAIYLFPKTDINKLEYNKILNYILPGNKDIINSLDFKLKNIENITYLNKIISNYGVSYDDLTNNNTNKIKKYLNDNLNSLSLDSKKKEQEYETFLKNKPSIDRKQCQKGFIYNRFTRKCEHLFIDNKSLGELEEFYGKYPFYNTFIDNSSNRLKWINSQADNGLLHYKKIMKNKLEFNQKHKEKTLEILRKDIHKFEQSIVEIESEINSVIAKLNSEGGDKCAIYVLSKIYNSVADLENDDYKEIKFDDNLVQNIGTNIVQLGHYALLKNGPVNKLYKRIEVDGKHIWSLESQKELDSILEKQKDFCNFQGKNISENSGYSYNSSDNCLTLDGKTCENKEITLLRNKKKEKEDVLKEKQESLKHLDNSDFYLQNITNQIKYLEQVVINSKKLEKIDVKQISIDTQDIDPKYKSIYEKIDKYLENIANLHDSQKYPHLKYLISKMSRENEEEENPKNIYCKYGNKVICCRHNLKMIEYFENNEEHILQELKDEYGVDVDGIHWCNNCGMKLDIDDFETMEGFKKSGARDVTHEEVVDDEDESEYGTTEIFETIKTVINKEETYLEKDVYGIVKILNQFLDIMGIKLNETDHESLFKKIELEITNNIRPKELWISETASKSKKVIKYEKLEQKYESYVTINVIYFTVSHLFIFLQTSIPEIEITKSHPVCNPSLAGYPITEEDDMRGIDYISCILQNLVRGGQVYSVLKAKTVKDNLVRTITKLLDDHFIKSLYEKKKKYIISSKTKVLDQKVTLSKWNEFRPPLSEITTSLEQLNDYDFNKLIFNLYNKDVLSTEINELILRYKENCFLYSSDLIKLYNYYTNLSEIANIKFHPTPLDNSCCLSDISDFKFDKYFNEIDTDRRIVSIKDELNNLHSIFDEINDYPINNLNYIVSVYPKKYLTSFRRDIFPKEPDETTINKLHIHFVSEGPFLGYKRIYDSNDICIFTGLSKNDILKRTYLLSDYNSLLRNIIDQRRIKINTNDYKILSSVEQFEYVIKNNKNYLESKILFNDYEGQLGWFNKYKQSIEDEDYETVEQLWELLEERDILIDKSEIVDTISQHLSLNKSNTDDLNRILELLAKFPNQELENINIIDQEELEFIENEKYRTKVIELKKLFKKLLIFVSRLQQTSEFIEDEFSHVVPHNWKLDPTQFSRLKGLYKAHLNELNKLNDLDKFTISIIIKIIKNGNLLDVLNSNSLDIDFKKCSIFLEYLFLSLVKNILSITEVNLSEGFEDLYDLNTSTNRSPSNSSNSLIIKKKEASRIMYEFFKYIDFEKNLFNKYTKNTIQRNIKKEAENSKEQNLEFIGQLDKEARQSLKMLLNVGLEVWKDISKRRNGNITDPNFEEEPSDDFSNEEELRYNASLQLGENFTDEQYREWLENRQISNREDGEIQQEIQDDYLEEDDDANALNYEE